MRTTSRKHSSSGLTLDLHAKVIDGADALLDKDAVLVKPESHVFGVADGISGTIGSEHASDVVMQVVETACGSDDFGLGKVEKRLGKALDLANRRIREYAEANGIGDFFSSFALLHLHPGKSMATMMYLGSCRLYVYRDHKLDLIADSADRDMPSATDSIVVDDAGHALSEKPARAIGLSANPEYDIRHYRFRENDLFMLCTDGLNRHESDSEILRILGDLENHELKHIAARLTAESRKKGALDNISMVLVRVRACRRRSPWMYVAPAVIGSLVAFLVLFAGSRRNAESRTGAAETVAVASTEETEISESFAANDGDRRANPETSPSIADSHGTAAESPAAAVPDPVRPANAANAVTPSSNISRGESSAAAADAQKPVRPAVPPAVSAESVSAPSPVAAATPATRDKPTETQLSASAATAGTKVESVSAPSPALAATPAESLSPAVVPTKPAADKRSVAARPRPVQNGPDKTSQHVPPPAAKETPAEKSQQAISQAVAAVDNTRLPTASISATLSPAAALVPDKRQISQDAPLLGIVNPAAEIVAPEKDKEAEMQDQAQALFTRFEKLIHDASASGDWSGVRALLDSNPEQRKRFQALSHFPIAEAWCTLHAQFGGKPTVAEQWSRRLNVIRQPLRAGGLVYGSDASPAAPVSLTEAGAAAACRTLAGTLTALEQSAIQTCDRVLRDYDVMKPELLLALHRAIADSTEGSDWLRARLTARDSAVTALKALHDRIRNAAPNAAPGARLAALEEATRTLQRESRALHDYRHLLYALCRDFQDSAAANAAAAAKTDAAASYVTAYKSSETALPWRPESTGVARGPTSATPKK